MTHRRTLVGRSALGILGLGAAILAGVVWTSGRATHAPVAGVALTDAEMSRIVGAFTRPKMTHYTDCPSCKAAQVGQVGTTSGNGTAAPTVNSGTGTVRDRVRGLGAAGVGGGVGVSFSYNSDLADGSNTALRLSMGYGWTHTYEMCLMESGRDMMWLHGDGTVSGFRGRFGTYQPLTGEFAALTAGPGSFTVRTTDGTQYFFNRHVVGGAPGDRWLMASVTDSDGRVTTLAYDASNRLTSVADQFGNTLQFTYDAMDRLIRVSDPLGRTMMFKYDTKANSLAMIMQADGSTIVYDYTVNMQVRGKFVYSAANFVTEQYKLLWDFRNNRVQEILDAAGTLLYKASSSNFWVVDRDTSTSTSEMYYTPGTAMMMDGLGHVWTYTYDSHGMLTRVDAPLVGGQPAVTTYTYEPSSLLVSSMTDPLGRTTSYQYDAHGNLTRVTDPESNVTQYSYTHPTIPRLETLRTDPDGRTRQYQYDPNGNLVTEIDALGQSATYGYNALGRMTSAVDRDGHVTTYTYDALSRETSQTRDPGGLGLTTTYGYDADGRQTSVTDPRGFTTTYQYDTRDRLTSTTDPLGHTTTSQYDERGNRLSVTDALGHTTTYQYDVRNRQTGLTDALGHTTTTVYDAASNVISRIDPLGHTATYTYDERNRRSSTVQDPGVGDLNITTRYTYDPVGNLMQRTHQMNAGEGPDRVTMYQYDSLNRLTTETRDPAGLNLTTRYDYAPPGAGCGCDGTPGKSNLHTLTDPAGHVTYFYYDELDRRTSTVRKVGDTADNMGDADDAITRTTYDPVGNVLESRVVNSPDPDLVTTYTYDAMDRRVLEHRDPSGANLTIATTYDADGNVLQVTEPAGNITTFVYDAADRLTSRSDSVGAVGSTGYDDANRITSTTDALGHTTTYNYDAANRLVSTIDALGHTSSTSYDADNRVISTTDPLGHTTTYAYDSVNRMTSTVRDPGGLSITTQYQYDANSNLIRQTAQDTTQSGATPQITQYQYDALDRRVRDINADDENGRPRDVNFTYDADSNLISVRDQNQDITGYIYDDLNRLTSRTFTPSGGSPTFPASQGPDTYTYDRASQLRSATHHEGAPDPDVLGQFTYDGVGRLVSTTQDGRVVQYGYTVNPATNRRELTYPSGRIVREDYDVRSRLSGVSDQPSGSPVSSFVYDAADRVTSQSRGNGVATTYTYDITDRPVRITHGSALDTVYGYDDSDNLLFSHYNHAPDTSELYRYDAADRIVDFQRGTLLAGNGGIASPTASAVLTQRQQWTLDQQGNWLSNSVRVNGADSCQDRFSDKANELNIIVGGACPSPVAGSGTPLTYDDNGNLSSDPTAPVGGGLLYDYDIANRLSRVRRTSDGLTIARYYYDALDQRVRKTVTNSGSLNGTANFVLDRHWRTVAEYDGAGTLVQEHVYGSGLDQRLCSDRNLNADGTAIGAGDQRLYHHHNVVGSVIGLTDASGGLREAYIYDAYGRQTVINDGPDGDNIVNFSADDIVTVGGVSAFGNAAMFTGRELDAETGLYYYRYRTYDARLGRFMSRDPIGFFDGTSLYEYATGNPIVDSDPSGLFFHRIIRQGVKIGRALVRWLFPPPPPRGVAKGPGKGGAGGAASGKGAGPGGAAGAGEAKPGQALLVKNIKGPEYKECGEFLWQIEWSLQLAAEKGGWVIQKVTFETNVQDCDGKDITAAKGGKPKLVYWEGWEIKKDKKKEEAGFDFSDQYSSKDYGICTKGTVSVTGAASFHDGLAKLPDTFKTPNPDTYAGDLPASTVDPKLEGGTTPLDHTLKVKWNCCPNKKKTEQVSKTP